MWDFEDCYGDSFTAAACSSCKSICADCPQPRLLPDALPSAAAYAACRSQWNYAPSGLPTGLRYGDCMQLLGQRHAALGIAEADMPDVIAGLQIVERAFVQARIEMWQQERANNGQHR